MKIVTVDSLDYVIMDPDYNHLLDIGQEFLKEMGLDPVREEIVGYGADTAVVTLLMGLFKAGETEEYKGIISKFIALLTVLGVEYQPVMLVKKGATPAD